MLLLGSIEELLLFGMAAVLALFLVESASCLKLLSFLRDSIVISVEFHVPLCLLILKTRQEAGTYFIFDLFIARDCEQDI